jgi:hypothetical protein
LILLINKFYVALFSCEIVCLNTLEIVIEHDTGLKYSNLIKQI